MKRAPTNAKERRLSSNQIESYEKPYNIVFGTWGTDDPQIFRAEQGADLPIYKARRWVLALLTSEIDKQEPEHQDALKILRQQFKDASVGDLVFGYVKRWTNAKGVERFIGIMPRGVDYRRAGVVPPELAAKPSTRRLPDRVVIEGRPWKQGPREASHPTPAPKPRRQSEAERIAAEMAKSSRAAAEGVVSDDPTP